MTTASAMKELKSGAREDEHTQMVNWRKYSNGDNSISKNALPANFDTQIAKGVIYIKNKESLNFEQFRKTYCKKTLKIAALNTALFLSYFWSRTLLENYIW